jgi:hypothetical protein
MMILAAIIADTELSTDILALLAVSNRPCGRCEAGVNPLRRVDAVSCDKRELSSPFPEQFIL